MILLVRDRYTTWMCWLCEHASRWEVQCRMHLRLSNLRKGTFDRMRTGVIAESKRKGVVEDMVEQVLASYSVNIAYRHTDAVVPNTCCFVGVDMGWLYVLSAVDEILPKCRRVVKKVEGLLALCYVLFPLAEESIVGGCKDGQAGAVVKLLKTVQGRYETSSLEKTEQDGVVGRLGKEVNEIEREGVVVFARVCYRGFREAHRVLYIPLQHRRSG